MTSWTDEDVLGNSFKMTVDIATNTITITEWTRQVTHELIMPDSYQKYKIRSSALYGYEIITKMGADTFNQLTHDELYEIFSKCYEYENRMIGTIGNVTSDQGVIFESEVILKYADIKTQIVGVSPIEALRSAHLFMAGLYYIDVVALAKETTANKIQKAQELVDYVKDWYFHGQQEQNALTLKEESLVVITVTASSVVTSQLLSEQVRLVPKNDTCSDFKLFIHTETTDIIIEPKSDHVLGPKTLIRIFRDINALLLMKGPRDNAFVDSFYKIGDSNLTHDETASLGWIATDAHDNHQIMSHITNQPARGLGSTESLDVATAMLYAFHLNPILLSFCQTSVIQAIIPSPISHILISHEDDFFISIGHDVHDFITCMSSSDTMNPGLLPIKLDDFKEGIEIVSRTVGL